MRTTPPVPESFASSPNGNKPIQNPEGKGLDIDDAQIEEPKDGAFKKAPQKEQPVKKRKKTGRSEFD